MLGVLLRASRAAASQVLAATPAFAQLRLRPLLCGVNSRGAIIAGNHLHTLLRPERRAKHLFRLALRPPGWPTCGDVNTHCSVSQPSAQRRRGGGSNYLSRDWKRKEMLVVVSTHISTQETDRHAFCSWHVYTPPCRAQAYLCTCSVNLKVPAGPRCVVLSVCVCLCSCREFLSSIGMSQNQIHV